MHLAAVYRPALQQQLQRLQMRDLPAACGHRSSGRTWQQCIAQHCSSDCSGQQRGSRSRGSTGCSGGARGVGGHSLAAGRGKCAAAHVGCGCGADDVGERQSQAAHWRGCTEGQGGCR